MNKDAIVSEDIVKKFAKEIETPYTRWVKAEGLDIIDGIYVPDLNEVALKPWSRRNGHGVFINHDASRTSNDCYVCEIDAGADAFLPVVGHQDQAESLCLALSVQFANEAIDHPVVSSKIFRAIDLPVPQHV